jgi:glycerol dehydrogenase-like iron-containing ADH family enzyme
MQLFNTVYGRNLIAEIPAIVPRPYLVVTMEDLWPLLGAPLADSADVHLVRTLDRDELETIIAGLPACEVVVGLGGGQAIDVAKIVATRRRVPLFQVPTSMSVNAPFGHRAAVRVDGVVRYVGWKVPEAVFVDYDVVQGAPPLLNRTGVGDIFCYHTAHWDWKFAESIGRCEPKWRYDEVWEARARAVLDSVVDGLDEIRECTELGIRTLMEGLRWGGAAYANAGWNPRSIEGAEHAFFYSLELNTRKHYIHGQPVGLGILLTAAMQDNEPERMREAMDRVGLPYAPEEMDITWDDVDDALRGMKQFAERNDLWYTIAAHQEITDDFLERARAWLTAPSGTRFERS